MCSVEVYRNPDEDFVLRGRSPSYRDKPGHLTNSQLTTTSFDLTQNSMYRPEKYQGQRETLGGSLQERYLRQLARQLERSSSGIRASLTKSSSIQTGDEEVARLMGTSQDRERFGGKPKCQSETEWYTRPIHLSHEYEEYPLFRSMGVSTKSFSGLKRPVGVTGAALASDRALRSKLYTSAEIQDHALTNMNDTEYQNFPVTLSSNLVGVGLPLVKPTAVMANYGIAPKLAPKRSKSPSQSMTKIRSRSATTRSHNLNSRKHVDKLFLMTSEAPVTSSSYVYVTSPYQTELARLRMEQLRLEEEQLLELKRGIELERIRGPKPKCPITMRQQDTTQPS